MSETSSLKNEYNNMNDFQSANEDHYHQQGEMPKSQVHALLFFILGFAGCPCFYLGNCQYLKSQDKPTKLLAWFSMFCCGCVILIPCLSITGSILGNLVTILFGIFTPKSYQFVVIGDWGDGSIQQKNVAETMKLQQRWRNFDFIVSLGDHFYWRGVDNTSDPLFKLYYEDMYRGPGSNLNHLDWYCVLGNHDWIKNPFAQIEYNKINPKWNLQMNYTKEITFSGNKKAQMIFMETSRYFQLERDRVPKIRNFSSIEMTNWLRQTLEEGDGKYQWRFVYGHYPFYSSGHYGDVGHRNMTEVEDLFVKHKVDAYFCGHQHILQHLEVPYKDHKIQYFISGAGGQTISNDIRNPNHTYSLFARGKEEGFMIHHLTEKASTVEVIGKGGKVIHTSLIKK